MAHGTVLTAKGVRLNMDELMMKARRPMKLVGDQKDTIKSAPRPAAQSRVRGFVPSAQGVPDPIVQVVETVQDDGPSMADYTGLTVDNPRSLKEKPVDSMAVATDTLQEIMGDLKQYATPARGRKQT
jgi:hypothetical protein